VTGVKKVKNIQIQHILAREILRSNGSNISKNSPKSTAGEGAAAAKFGKCKWTGSKKATQDS